MYAYIYICISGLALRAMDALHPKHGTLSVRASGSVKSTPFTSKSKVVVQSTLLTQRANRFTRALPSRGSRDPLRFAEGGVLPYKGARQCPGFSLRYLVSEGLWVGEV